MWHDAIITTAIRRDAQELRDAFLAIDTGDGQLDAFELEEAARKVVPWLALLEQQKSFWMTLSINVGIRRVYSMT